VFARLGRWCFHHRIKVAIGWFGLFVIGGALTGVWGTAFSTEFALPDVESRRGFDILDEHFADSTASDIATARFSVPPPAPSSQLLIASETFCSAFNSGESASRRKSPKRSSVWIFNSS
jgi:RND superfamily putative drug exporter